MQVAIVQTPLRQLRMHHDMRARNAQHCSEVGESRQGQAISSVLIGHLGKMANSEVETVVSCPSLKRVAEYV